MPDMPAACRGTLRRIDKTTLRISFAHGHLRPLQPADVHPCYVEGLNDPEVNRYLVTVHNQRQTIDSVRAFVEEQSLAPDAVLFGIWLEGQSAHCGTLRLHGLDGRASAHIGICLFERAVWGRGIGSAAIVAATQWAFQALAELHSIEAGAYLENAASWKSFLKAGYTASEDIANVFLRKGQPATVRRLVCTRPQDRGDARQPSDRAGTCWPSDAMTRQLSSADCYEEFDRRLDAVGSWIGRVNPSFAGYSGEAVGWRFRQRCAELALPAFVLEASRRFQQSGNMPAAVGAVNCDGLCLEADGRAVVSPRRFLRSLVEFAGHWIHAFIAIISSLRLDMRHGQPGATLLFGVGMESLVAGGSDAQFLAYCRGGPIIPLKFAKRMVIQAVSPIVSTDSPRIRYGRYPLFSTLAWRGLSLPMWLRAIGNHVLCLGSFLSLVCRWPSGIILGRDAAHHATAEALSHERALESVVLTNSNYSAQPLWMWAMPRRAHHLHMVWYSQNSRPIVYVNDTSYAALSNLRYLRLDDIWVWTESFKRFLESRGCNATFHVVGPILWYLPEEQAPLVAQRDKLSLAVFDVTPVNAETEQQLAIVRNYYCEANAKRFISDVMAVAGELESTIGSKVEVVLKHKRENNPIHAVCYIEFINALAEAGKLTLLPPSTNLYSLIDGSAAVVAVPFSSPVYVGLARGCPSVWYDPTGLVVYNLDEVPGIRYCGSRAELLAVLKEALLANNPQRLQ